jgi:DNA modification methylase
MIFGSVCSGIQAGAPAQGIVLDPFMGAGTTALVAARLNRQFIGIELNPEYVKIAERRIAGEVAQQKFL